MEVQDANSSALFLTIEEPEPTDLENRTGMTPTGFRVEYRTNDEPQWNAQSFPLAEGRYNQFSNFTLTFYRIKDLNFRTINCILLLIYRVR